MSAGKPSADVPAGNPATRRGTVEQREDYAGMLDCVAHITKVPVEQLRATAKNLRRLPRTRRWPKYWALAAKLLNHHGWQFGEVKPVGKTSRLPSLAIVQTAPKVRPGGHSEPPRFLVLERRGRPGERSWVCLIDPRPGVSPREYVRYDVDGIALTHYLEVWWVEQCDDF